MEPDTDIGMSSYPRVGTLANTNETIIHQAHRNTKLAAENEELRARLLQFQRTLDGRPKSSSGISAQDSASGQRTSTCKCEELKAAKKQYDDLLVNYERLNATFEAHKVYVVAANRKYRAAKQNAKDWKNYLDSKRMSLHQHVLLGNSAQHPGSDPTIGMSSPLVSPAATIARPPRTEVAKPSISDEAETSLGDQRVSEPAIAKHSPGHREREHPGIVASDTVQPKESSQATEVETAITGTADQVTKSAPSSDDEPQVVSARSLKRRRSIRLADDHTAPRRIKVEPGSDADIIELSSEDSSSTHKVRQQAMRQETSDLDVQSQLDRKPKQLLITGVTEPHAASEGSVRQHIQLDQSTSLLDCVKFDSRSNKLGHHHGQKGPDTKLEWSTADHNEAGRTLIERPALTPLSINVASSPPSTESKSKGSRMYRGIATLLEDGSDVSSQASESREHPKTDEPHGDRAERLNKILDGTIADDKHVLMRRSPGPVKPRDPAPKTNHKRFTAVGEAPEEAPLRPSSRHKPARQPVRIPDNARQASRSPPPVRPEEEPLRLRPLTSLGLEDFKVNRKYMSSNFAFADSLRDKAAKRCVPGCTHPSCCGGALNDLVALGLLPATSKSDAEVLEAYLGDSWEMHVGALGPVERRELLVKARAFALANEHGKHRQAFERRCTPPGFWRTDFPTTQESKEDRAKADEMVREEVERRYLDAVRGGGRWKFRDE